MRNGKTAIPAKAWKAEYAKRTAERKTLTQRYLSRKEEVKEARQIRKSVYSILRQEQPVSLSACSSFVNLCLPAHPPRSSPVRRAADNFFRSAAVRYIPPACGA